MPSNLLAQNFQGLLRALAWKYFFVMYLKYIEVKKRWGSGGVLLPRCVFFFFSPACRRGKRVRDLAKGDKQDKELASLTSLTSMPARDIKGTTHLAYETSFSCSNTIS